MAIHFRRIPSITVILATLLTLVSTGCASEADPAMPAALPSTITPTLSPTFTANPVYTAIYRLITMTYTPTITPTPSITPSPTISLTPTISQTPTETRVPTLTPGPTATKQPTETLATPPTYLPLLSHIYTNVKVYYGDGKEYVFTIVGGSESCSLFPSGRGIYVQTPDGRLEWKDRNALLQSGLYFVRLDDPYINWGKIDTYDCPRE